MVDFRLLLLIFLSTSLGNLVTGNVPALLWTNRESDFTSPLAGHTLSSDEFHQKYLQSLQPDQDLVIFLQDRLNLEDFTEHADVYNENSQGGVFHNLKSLMEQHTSAQVPSINSAATSLDKLHASFGGEIHDLKAPYSLKDLHVQKRSIINVHLPDTGVSKASFHKALSKIDGIIGSVTSQLKSAGRRFTAIYTARDSAQSDEGQKYTGRHLLEVAQATTGYTFLNFSSCIFLYATEIHFQMLQNNVPVFDEMLPNNGNGTTNGTIGTTNATITLLPQTNCSGDGNAILAVQYSGLGGNITKLKLEMNFWLEARWWYVNTTVGYVLKNGTSGSTDLDTQNLAAPYDYSYKCFTPDSFTVKYNNTIMAKASDGPALVFKSLQVQPNVENDQFSDADDCIGAFSLPIWMGLFSSLILILIISFGVTMIANIETQDRFDDPKGKPLVINVMGE